MGVDNWHDILVFNISMNGKENIHSSRNWEYWMHHMKKQMIHILMKRKGKGNPLFGHDS